MTRSILIVMLVALCAAQEAAAAHGGDDATVSPPRPDMYCSERQRTVTVERFEARVALWRAASEKEGMPAERRRAAAYLERFEDELALVRAAPVYRCTVRLDR